MKKPWIDSEDCEDDPYVVVYKHATIQLQQGWEGGKCMELVDEVREMVKTKNHYEMESNKTFSHENLTRNWAQLSHNNNCIC